MSKSNPRIIFGVHGATPYNKATGAFYGELSVLGGSSVTLSGELKKLNGGSLKYPWAVEDGLITAEVSLKIKEYANFLFELFLGKAPTTSGVDTAGMVSAPVAKVGTLINATTGVDSVSVTATTGAASLKFGKYVLKALSATTVGIFTGSSIDFAHGTAAVFASDLLQVGSALTVVSATDTDIPELGLTITGGSGTIALVAGDAIAFEVKPPSSKSMEVVIGGAADVFPEFGCLIYSKKRGNNEMFEIDVYRMKAVGLPFSLEENAFSEGEIKGEAFYDAEQNGIMKIRTISPS
jgi:hypothetical protein